jgi:methyltransferase (TIGR00027 family)
MAKDKASFTALVVAQGLIACAESRDWGHLVGDEARELTKYFAEFALKNHPDYIGWSVIKSSKLLPYSWQQGLLDKISTPGQSEHYAMRKLLIEQQVEKAINDEGKRQVVILGGGYDTLALRLHKKYPKVNFFEVDKGLSQLIKKRAIGELEKGQHGNELLNKYEVLGTNLSYVECDLNIENNLTEELLLNGFDIFEKTIFIAEGLSMYLEEKTLNRMLKDINEIISNNKSSLLISFREPRETTLASQALRGRSDEIYHSALMPETAPAEIHRMGYTIQKKAMFIDLQTQAKNMVAVLKHKSNPNHTKEHYYLMVSKKENDQIKDIKEIENMAVEEPNKPKLLYSQGLSCNVL